MSLHIIKELLELVSKEFVTGNKFIRHAITFHEEKVCLSIMHKAEWHPFYLDDADLNKTPQELITEIKDVLASDEVKASDKIEDEIA